MSEHKNKPVADSKKVVQRAKEDLEKLKKLEIPTRRVKMLMVNPSDFVFLFTKGLRFRKNFVLVKGVPDDAKVLTAVADSARNGIMIVVQSDSYEPIPINIMPPVEPVEIDVTALDATKKHIIPKRKKRS